MVHQRCKLLYCFRSRRVVPGLIPSFLSQAILFDALLKDCVKSWSNDKATQLCFLECRLLIELAMLLQLYIERTL